MQRLRGSFRNHAPVPLRDVVPRAAHSNPPTQDDWTRIQGTIYEYYVVEKLPLHVVRARLKSEHDFRASERMIKARLAKWEYIKNAKREDWGYLAVLHEIRRKENKPTTFRIRGHRKSVKDLQRFIRNQNISPEKFIEESFANFREKGERIPDYIRALTPDPDDALYSPSADTSLDSMRSPSPAMRIDSTPLNTPEQRDQQNLLDEKSPSRSSMQPEGRFFEHKCPYKCYATELNRGSVMTRQNTKVSSSSSTTRQPEGDLDFYSSEQRRLELEACSQQLLKPMPLIHKIGENDMRCWMVIHQHNSSPSSGSEPELTEQEACSRCDQPCNTHFPSLDLFQLRRGQRNILNDTAGKTLRLPASTRDEGSWSWVALCFLACMSFTKGDENFARDVLGQAEDEFQELLSVSDPLLLTAANLMITVLHMHNQNTIVVKILNSAKNVVDRVLPANDPIRLTISYLALTADTSSANRLLRENGFSSARLRDIYHQLRDKYKSEHPYTIAAHHNYAWMLKYENKKAKAEKHAKQTYCASVKYFGKLHMQSITSLSVAAGCIADETGRGAECANLYRLIILNATQILGVIHPYTLEAQRRLAACLRRMPGEMEKVLEINRIILFGRAAMLGKHHEFTRGQKRDYISLLEELGRWLNRDGTPSIEQSELKSLYEKHPEEAWEFVSRPLRESIRRGVEDFEMIDGPDSEISSGGRLIENLWVREAMTELLSRSASPTSSNDYEAY